MHLRKYPLDKQACPLVIGSCKYEDLNYVLNNFLGTVLYNTKITQSSIPEFSYSNIRIDILYIY